MLPIAYVVVEVKNKDSWSWFLELLIEDIGRAKLCVGCTFMLYQHKVIPHICFSIEFSFV